MAVKVGIIGAGYIGGVHARILAQDERVKLVGIADVLETRAKELAMIVGAQPFPSAEALLAAGIDAVYVCTPNTMHLAPVLAALQAGGHVFSEKPMATRWPRRSRSSPLPDRPGGCTRSATTGALPRCTNSPSRWSLPASGRPRRTSR